ncbi:MAG: hypothetical protein ACE5GB_02910 [Acidimicrobiales bacterium]
MVVRLSAVMVADAFNESIFECGETVNGVTTVCSADSVLDMPAGDTVMIAQTLSAPVASEPWQYTYAAVLDRDGDPANNFVAQAMFDWDYFQNTDTWYVIDRIEGAWSGGLYHGDFGSPQPSAFRAVISDNTVLWFIPTSELPSPSGVRTTAFRHDGSFAPEVSGGDVIGPDPTIGLSSINPSDIEVGAVGSAVPRGATPVEPVDGPDPDPVELVRAFIGEFETAQDNRDSGFLFETLAPQVIDRYGSAQCEDYLGATVGSVTGFRIDAVNGPVDYTYATDDLVTVVDDQVYAADLRFDANGTELTATANYRIVDGVVSWFTDCGEPVG